jgi:integrase
MMARTRWNNISMARRRKLDPGVSSFVDQHGKERFRFRKVGFRSTYLPPPGSPEYREAYRAAINGRIGTELRAKPRSIDDLVSRFYRSGAFHKAGEVRRARARGIIESFRAEYGRFQVTHFKFDLVERILQTKAVKRYDEQTKRQVGGRVAAENLRKELRRLFKLAVKLEWIASSPIDHAEGVKQEKGGYHSWTEEEIAQYRERWEIGSYARAALEIILWTWQRRGDAHLFGPAHLKGDKVKYTQAKTGKTLWLPAAPQMIAAIRALPAIGTKTFIVTAFGKPFTNAGFGNKFREWCDAAGLPHCTAHGLRKAGARRAAELGATNQELKAAGGWSTSKDVDTYTADAGQEGLARGIMERLIEWDQ